jgi:F-type H+-transporting ATPase subunit b
MTLLGRFSARLLIAVLLGTFAALPAASFGQEEVAETAGDEGAHDGETHEAPNPIVWSNDLALWSIVVFLLFLAALTKLAWKPLTQGLDARERRIRDDIGAAEEARLKAERMLAEHAAKLDRVQDEVKAILAEARRDAEVARQNIVATAASEADATKKRAISEIERARDQALKELFDTMASQVADATEHVLGRGLNDGDQQRLIDEALSRFSERPMATRA